MSPRPARPPRRARGSVLAVVLVLLVAGMALSAAMATTAALEHAMAGGSISLLRARQAAETGLSEALAARGWSAAGSWSDTGVLPDGAEWAATVRLVSARLISAEGTVEWLFEIESAASAGAARTTMAQAFKVRGTLPGDPLPAWWRLKEDPP